jgi:hypothetical protein
MATFWSSANVEPKRKFKFLVRINPPQGSTYDIPSFVVKKVDKPGFTITETKHTFLGHNFFFPGKLEWKEISLTIVDPAGTGVNPEIKRATDEGAAPDMSWTLVEILGQFGYQTPVSVGGALNGSGDVNALSNDPNSIGKIKSFSKAAAVSVSGNMEILQIDDEGNIVEIWALKNAWIKDIQFGSNDYSSDDAQEVAIKFRYDWAEFSGGNGSTFQKATYVVGQQPPIKTTGA